jgi:hypothetical protein
MVSLDQISTAVLQQVTFQNFITVVSFYTLFGMVKNIVNQKDSLTTIDIQSGDFESIAKKLSKTVDSLQNRVNFLWLSLMLLFLVFWTVCGELI